MKGIRNCICSRKISRCGTIKCQVCLNLLIQKWTNRFKEADVSEPALSARHIVTHVYVKENASVQRERNKVRLITIIIVWNCY